jgi:mono/diheme cytochrome c family protein
MSSWKLAIPILVAVTGFIALPDEKSPLARTSDLSGAEMYRNYCASCHGIDGKGGGPAAPALRRVPPDLTGISARNKGQYPDFRITHIIDGYEIAAFHGSHEMPIWGDYFRENETRDEALIKLREHNLVEYIRSMQQK